MSDDTGKGVQRFDAQRFGAAAPQDSARDLAQETPVAMVFDGTTVAVLLATPCDIHDFALGFALSEGIITHPDQLRELDIVPHAQGIEARIWLREDRAQALQQRRRSAMGPVGCGLCGIDSLDQAIRPLPQLHDLNLTLPYAAVNQASAALRARQPLHSLTRAKHAAGFMTPDGQMHMAREDVGRHNALDKLIGALAHQGLNPASGAFVLTSRVSLELVQKTAMAGCAALIAVSSPTALAVQSAQAAGVSLATNAAGNGFEVFSQAQRFVAADAPGST